MFPIVEKLGGWAPVDQILADRGLTFSNEARKKWQAKGRAQLPRNVVAILSAEANARGISFVPEDFNFSRQSLAAE